MVIRLIRGPFDPKVNAHGNKSQVLRSFTALFKEKIRTCYRCLLKRFYGEYPDHDDTDTSTPIRLNPLYYAIHAPYEAHTIYRPFE